MSKYIAKTVAFVGWLVFRSPVLLPILQEHLEDNGGDVLPHVILFQIREWMESELVARGETDEIRMILESLKTGLQDGDYEMEALVQVSFVDDLSEAPHPAHRLKKMLDPNL